MKLTKAQKTVLASIARTGWWPKGTHYNTRFALVARGLVNLAPASEGPDSPYRVTAAGHAILTQQEL